MKLVSRHPRQIYTHKHMHNHYYLKKTHTEQWNDMCVCVYVFYVI